MLILHIITNSYLTTNSQSNFKSFTDYRLVTNDTHANSLNSLADVIDYIGVHYDLVSSNSSQAGSKCELSMITQVYKKK